MKRKIVRPSRSRKTRQSLAIGRGGQNVRLAARLTGWKIDIRSAGGEQVAAADTADVTPDAPAEASAKEGEKRKRPLLRRKLRQKKARRRNSKEKKTE